MYIPYIKFDIKTDRILKYETAVFIKQFPRFRKMPSVLDKIRLAYLIHFVDSKAHEIGGKERYTTSHINKQTDFGSFLSTRGGFVHLYSNYFSACIVYVLMIISS